MNIGFDLDNTLIHLDIIDILANEYNYPCTIQQYTDWNMNNFPKYIQSKAMKLFRDHNFMCENIKTIKGAKKIISELSKDHNIFIITARVKKLHKKTEKLVNELFPEVKGFHCVGYNKSKKDLFIENKLDIWIDDAPHGVKDALDCGIITYLISNNKTRYNWHIKDLPNLNVVSSVNKIEI